MKLLKAVTFQEHYEWLPSIIFFWYSFFFLILLQIYGPFAIVDNWLIVNFSRPGFALFSFIENAINNIIGSNMSLRGIFYAESTISFGIVFSLALISVILANLIIIRIFRTAKQ